MKRYGKYIKPYWAYFLASPCLMVVEVYADVQIPALAADIINLGVAQNNPNLIYQLCARMLFMLCLAIIGGVGAAYCASKAAVFFSCDLREDLFDKIQSFSFADVDKFSSGSLVTRLTNDVTQLEQMVIVSLRMMFRAPGMLFGSLIMAFLINKELSIIFFVMIPCLALVIALILRVTFRRFAILQEKIDNLNQTIREALVNVRVIKGLAREDYETKKFNAVNKDLKESALSAYFFNILQLPLMTLVINMCTVAILYYGGLGLMNETISSGDITAFITYTTQILMAVAMLSMVFMQCSRAGASSGRIRQLLDTMPCLSDDMARNPDKKVETGKIEFKNVSFKYGETTQEKILSNINLTIESGETIGIIGSTGSGKTSLIQLIPRLYDVNSGSILVDGIDVKDYSLENLRDGVSVVLQNNLLFSGSIIENLRWGKKEANPSEVEAVATWSAAHEFIDKMPEKYDSYVQQGGSNFSGGQKQRMCIARALLKNPKILILDDSTSAVDTATEAEIRSYLSNQLSGVTKLIIAQRISSVMYADQIIVLNDGEVESVGCHDDLMKCSKTYQEVYLSQINKEVME